MAFKAFEENKEMMSYVAMSILEILKDFVGRIVFLIRGLH